MRRRGRQPDGRSRHGRSSAIAKVIKTFRARIRTDLSTFVVMERPIEEDEERRRARYIAAMCQRMMLKKTLFGESFAHDADDRTDIVGLRTRSA